MPRAVDEWVGKSGDAKIPDRVRIRVFERHGRRCALCGNEVKPGDGTDFDHAVPLADGGEHRETNLRPVHRKCHRLKTAREAQERASVRAVVAKTYGLKSPKRTGLEGRTIRYSRARGCWVNRETGEPVQLHEDIET